MTATATPATLASALVEAQKEMPAVDKTGNSNFGAHVTLDHLISKTRQHLAKNGLAIMQFPAVSENGSPLLRTVLMHTSGESVQADTPLFLDRQTMQSLGGAITYARRYGWSSVLGISTEEDDDGDAVSKPAEAKPANVAPASAEQKTQGADTSEPDAKLLALVTEKGGDAEKVAHALESAKTQGKYDAYYATTWAFWEKKFVAPTTVRAA